MDQDQAYINDSADCSDSIWAVYDFKVWLHVLHDTRGDHKHVLRDLCEFLDNEVDHLSQSGLDSSKSGNRSVSRGDYCTSSIACSSPPEMLIKAGNGKNDHSTHILVLEQLGHAKEERSSLLRAESLSNVKQVDDLRQEYPTFARTYRGFIEDARFLNDGRLVLEEDADWRERRGGEKKVGKQCQLCEWEHRYGWP